MMLLLSLLKTVITEFIFDTISIMHNSNLIDKKKHIVIFFTYKK